MPWMGGQTEEESGKRKVPLCIQGRVQQQDWEVGGGGFCPCSLCPSASLSERVYLAIGKLVTSCGKGHLGGKVPALLV